MVFKQLRLVGVIARNKKEHWPKFAKFKGERGCDFFTFIVFSLARVSIGQKRL